MAQSGGDDDKRLRGKNFQEKRKAWAQKSEDGTKTRTTQPAGPCETAGRPQLAANSAAGQKQKGKLKKRKRKHERVQGT